MTDQSPYLPPRPADGHKGTFGTVGVLGGQVAEPNVMLGGPCFTALAALRSGCGLVRLLLPKPLMPAGLSIAPEATGIALPVDRHGRLRASDAAERIDTVRSNLSCLALGPGFGAGPECQQIIARLIALDDVPLVIDADGLNALAEMDRFDQDLRAGAILTPHPGEFARLADALNLDVDVKDQSQREHAAAALAQRLGCVVVLKTNQTIISDGIHTFTNTTGTVALATAGSGDVLTGVIAGLVAQFHRPDPLAALAGRGSAETEVNAPAVGSLLHCAQLGVYLHGLAADLWAEKYGQAGLLVRELLDQLPAARHAMEQSQQRSHPQ